MSHGIEQSIRFTVKLIATMEQEFGPSVLDLANSIATAETRASWVQITAENAIDTYIKNMQFTVNFLEGLKQQFGARIAEMTSQLISEEEQVRWCAVAKQQQDHSIEQFIRLVWEPLIPLGFQFTTEKRADGIQLHCTSCPIHELSKAIGGAEWLALLECDKDLHNVKGFNPKIGFSRTKTLMKGDSHCNHFYFENNDAE
jgi:predicted ArsR family transcriptional regulator